MINVAVEVNVPPTPVKAALIATFLATCETKTSTAAVPRPSATIAAPQDATAAPIESIINPVLRPNSTFVIVLIRFIIVFALF